MLGPIDDQGGVELDYLLDLTENEIKYICEAIPYQETSMYFRKYPSEFGKLKPGFRVKTLTKEMIVRTLYEFRRKNFVASYLIKHINRWIKEIEEELENAYKEGFSQEEAYITVLSDSYFGENIPLFFKIKEEKKTAEYLKVLGAAVHFEATRKKEERKKNERLSEEIRRLSESKRELEQQISNEQEKTEKLNQYKTDIEAEVERSFERLREAQEIRKALEARAENLEVELKKVKDSKNKITSEMQQCINLLEQKIGERSAWEKEQSANLLQLESQLASAESDIQALNNQLKERGKQLHLYETEVAKLLAEKEKNAKQIKLLQESLEEKRIREEESDTYGGLEVTKKANSVKNDNSPNRERKQKELECENQEKKSDENKDDISEKKDSEEVLENNQLEAYVLLSTKKAVCKACGQALEVKGYSYVGNKGKTHQIYTKRCVNCGKEYISCGTYIAANEANIVCLNPDELATIKTCYYARKRRQNVVVVKPRRDEKVAENNYCNSMILETSKKKNERPCNYCMCELRNITTEAIVKVTINSALQADVLDQKNWSYPAKSEMGRQCLRAAANDYLQTITVNGICYNVERTVRYDTNYVDQYIEENNEEPLNDIEPKAEKEIKFKDFVIRRTIFRCRCSGHQLENIDAVITLIGKNGNLKTKKVSAGYCQVCNIYFILESTYQDLKGQGILACRVCEEEAYLNGAHCVKGMKLASESIIRQYGYNVSKEEGLSAARRRKILSLLIDNDILTKNEIINYLEFFISQHKKTKKFEKAVEKWETDKKFISEYKLGDYTQIGVAGIYRKRNNKG